MCGSYCGGGRYDVVVEALGAPDPLGPELPALGEGDVARGDVDLFQGHHAHNDTLLIDKIQMRLFYIF